MKRVGIFSGSFDPIHIGHQHIAEYVLSHQLTDEVWFVVSPSNPLKDTTHITDPYIRIDMVWLAIQHECRYKVSDIECTMPIPSYSIDTLHALSSEYVDCQFSLIIGSDNALTFDQWKDYKNILKDFSVLVYPRQEQSFTNISALYPQMQLLSSPLYDISSTKIRNDIACGKNVKTWLHPLVYQYIMDNNLYGVNRQK